VWFLFIDKNLGMRSGTRLPGETERVKAVMAARIAFLVSVRRVYEVDFVFMSDEEVLFVECF
jgi:hypothetical protein